MYPRYRRKQQNPVEKVMRPGVLLLSLLIGLAIVFLLTPSPAYLPAAADGTGEEHAAVEEPAVLDEDYDDEADQQATTDDTDTDNQVDDTSEQDGSSHEGGEAGEGYDDNPEPRPGDDEEDGEATVEDEDDADEDESSADDERHRECIYVPSIDTFHIIDDKHLTVSTSPRRIYLVTLWNRCHGLKWSHQIAIKSFSSWTCSYSRDTIITEDSRCIIDDIERVESNEAAESIVADRTEGEG